MTSPHRCRNRLVGEVAAEKLRVLTLIVVTPGSEAPACVAWLKAGEVAS